MSATAEHSNVVPLRRPRGGPTNYRQLAQVRLTELRRASGLSAKVFAERLTEALGWPATPEAVTAWESVAVPQGDVLLAAEELARSSGQTDLRMVGTSTASMSIIDSYVDVQAALAAVVDSAHEGLAITGSRSRDPNYLTRIETAIAERADLVHYRVLYGPPRHGALKSHLLRLVDLHRRDGTLKIGMFSDLFKDSERFICASEEMALIVLPSANSMSNFDTALVINDPDVARDYVDHVRQAYLGSEPLTTRSSIETLEVLR